MRKDQQTIPQSNQEFVQASGRHEELGDFSTSLRVLPISGLAVIIGALCAFVALALLRLIGLFTNLFILGAGLPRWYRPSETIWAGTASSFRSPER